MKVPYDMHYVTDNLFGDPYPELIAYFQTLNTELNVLDVGCGQGRDAITIARLGFNVVGLDNSRVGINQMNDIVAQEKLKLEGIVTDIYSYTDYNKFDVILLDSMFHFYSQDAKKERAFIANILDQVKPDTLIVFCVPNKPNIINHLKEATTNTSIVFEKDLIYTYVDEESGNSSNTDYKIISVKRN